MVRSLYAYRRSCMDLEIGLSAGAIHVDADQFVLDRKADLYRATDHRTCWMPMLNELRVAFVYRLQPSAQTRYRFNHKRYMERLEQREERKKQKEAADDERRKKKEEAKAERRKKKEEAKAERLRKKEEAKAAATDSVNPAGNN